VDRHGPGATGVSVWSRRRLNDPRRNHSGLRRSIPQLPKLIVPPAVDTAIRGRRAEVEVAACKRRKREGAGDLHRHGTRRHRAVPELTAFVIAPAVDVAARRETTYAVYPRGDRDEGHSHCRGNRGGMHRVGRRAVAKLALIIGPRAPCRSRSIEATGVEMADGHHGVDRACTHDLAVDHPEAEGDASGRHSAIVTLPLGEQAPRVTAQAHDRGQRRNVAGAESAVVVPTPTPGCGAGVERARRAVEVR